MSVDRQTFTEFPAEASACSQSNLEEWRRFLLKALCGQAQRGGSTFALHCCRGEKSLVIFSFTFSFVWWKIPSLSFFFLDLFHVNWRQVNLATAAFTWFFFLINVNKCMKCLFNSFFLLSITFQMSFASDKLYDGYLRLNMPTIVTNVKVRQIVPYLPCLTAHDRVSLIIHYVEWSFFFSFIDYKNSKIEVYSLFL